MQSRGDPAGDECRLWAPSLSPLFCWFLVAPTLILNLPAHSWTCPQMHQFWPRLVQFVLIIRAKLFTISVFKLFTFIIKRFYQYHIKQRQIQIQSCVHDSSFHRTLLAHLSLRFSHTLTDKTEHKKITQKIKKSFLRSAGGAARAAEVRLILGGEFSRILASTQSTPLLSPSSPSKLTRYAHCWFFW